MEKKKAKPVPAAVKGTPQKPAPKKRRLLLKFLFVFFLIVGLAVAGLYQRWFPLDPELDANRFRRSEGGVCLITQKMIDRLEL